MRDGHRSHDFVDRVVRTHALDFRAGLEDHAMAQRWADDGLHVLG
jgi:hypothetical protein